MNGKKIAAMALGFVLLFSACPRPRHQVVRFADKSAAQVLQSLLRQSAQRQRLSGLLRIEYLGTDGLFKGDADLAIERPDRLRMSLRSFFGQPLIGLASDGQRLVFVDNTHMQVRCAPKNSPQIRALLPGGLSLQQTIAVMLGGLALPQLDAQQARRVQYFPPLEKDDLAIRWMSARLEIIVETDLQVKKIKLIRVIDRATQVWWRLRFTKFTRTATGPFAQEASLSWSDRRGRLRWRWRDFDLNPQVRQAQFWTLQMPAGFTLEEGCNGGVN